MSALLSTLLAAVAVFAVTNVDDIPLVFVVIGVLIVIDAGTVGHVVDR